MEAMDPFFIGKYNVWNIQTWEKPCIDSWFKIHSLDLILGC
jgi:hypothetical protein